MEKLKVGRDVVFEDGGGGFSSFAVGHVDHNAAAAVSGAGFAMQQQASLQQQTAVRSPQRTLGGNGQAALQQRIRFQQQQQLQLQQQQFHAMQTFHHHQQQQQVRFQSFQQQQQQAMANMPKLRTHQLPIDVPRSMATIASDLDRRMLFEDDEFELPDGVEILDSDSDSDRDFDHGRTTTSNNNSDSEVTARKRSDVVAVASWSSLTTTTTNDDEKLRRRQKIERSRLQPRIDMSLAHLCNLSRTSLIQQFDFFFFF